jgi:hypothetical protein
MKNLIAGIKVKFKKVDGCSYAELYHVETKERMGGFFSIEKQHDFIISAKEILGALDWTKFSIIADRETGRPYREAFNRLKNLCNFPYQGDY